MTNVTKFTLASKSIFATYARCEETKEDLLAFLIEKGCHKAVVAEEKHQDGGTHLHAYAGWEKQKRFSQKTLDWRGHHPNIQSCKNIHAVIKYIKKDGNFLEHNMSISAIEKAKKSHTAVIAEELILGKKTLREATEENPELLYRYGTLRKNLELFKTDRALETKKADPEEYPTEKKRHIWIWGGPDSGKTTKMEEILAEYPGNTFQIPYNNDWQGYLGERILWADEYKGQLTIQELNRVCDGGAKVNTKGGTVTLHKKPQVILASNYDPSGCYCKADSTIVETIQNRFNITIWNYRDHIGE